MFSIQKIRENNFIINFYGENFAFTKFLLKRRDNYWILMPRCCCKNFLKSTLVELWIDKRKKLCGSEFHQKKKIFREINSLVICCFHEIFTKKVLWERISIISTLYCVLSISRKFRQNSLYYSLHSAIK